MKVVYRLCSPLVTPIPGEPDIDHLDAALQRAAKATLGCGERSVVLVVRVDDKPGNVRAMAWNGIAYWVRDCSGCGGTGRKDYAACAACAGLKWQVDESAVAARAMSR